MKVPTLKLIPVYVYEHPQKIDNPIFDDKPVICESKDCPLRYQCRHHTTAGEFRSEDGICGGLVYFFGRWYCSMHPHDEFAESKLIEDYGSDWFERLSADADAPPLWSKFHPNNKHLLNEEPLFKDRRSTKYS